MIIKSNCEFKIGEVITTGGITDNNGKFHLIPFLVIRITTKEEFLKESDGKLGLLLKDDKFYEVSID